MSVFPRFCCTCFYPAFFLLFLCAIVSGQLVINVRNQGGDVVQETISANVADDTVSLEFQRSDGTLVTQLIDFRNEVHILKALVLGEEERGQSQYQVMCFIFHTPKDAFIPSDAMSKLRQKNPGTIRVPEDDRGRTNYTLDHTVVLKRASVISPHIADMCAEAADSTYTRYEDVRTWANIQGFHESVYASALKRFPTIPDTISNSVADSATSISDLQNCADVKKVWSPCQCHLELCVGWYPCGLKYCKGKGENKSSMTYRCGIKTCKKCSQFAYYVPQKQQCLWDE